MAGKKKAPKRKEYICMQPCWHNGSRFRKGQVVFFAGNYPKDDEGNLCHFEEINRAAPPSPPVPGPVVVNEKERPEK